MSARRISRCLANHVYVNCIKTRSRHHTNLIRNHLNITAWQTSRLLSTTHCCCTETNDNEDGSKPKSELDVKNEKTEETSPGVAPNKAQSTNMAKSRVTGSKKALTRTKSLNVKETCEAAGSSDSSSSGSDSSESDSDSDREAKAKVDPDLDKAAERVAEILPGDKAKNKNELLSKLVSKMKRPAVDEFFNTKPLTKPLTKPQKKRLDAPQTEQAKMVKTDAQDTDKSENKLQPKEVKEVSPKGVKAAKQKTEEEAEKLTPEEIEEKKREVIEKMTAIPLMKKLQETDQFERRRSDRDIESFHERMKDKRGVREEQQERFPGFREEQQERFPRQDKPAINVNSVFDGIPFGIFKKADPTETKPPEKKYLFDIVEEEEAQQMFPPQNAWQEQLQWTKQGKLWTFPIDNEAGWDEEKAFGFQDHVFLERQLKDFPQKGPIRHFMELVTVAMSKNPYMTVQQKRETIDWYRNYFKTKEAALIGPLGDMAKFKELPNTDTKSS